MEAVAKDNQAIKNVINRVYEMSEDERRIALAREMAEFDIASRLYDAKMDGETRGRSQRIDHGVFGDVLHPLEVKTHRPEKNPWWPPSKRYME